VLRNALVIVLIAALAVIVVPVILVLPVIGLRVFAPLRMAAIERPRINVQRFAFFRVLSFRAPPAFA
jgi:hypothetical protein